MQRAIRWYDYITVNVYFLGLTVLSQTNGLVFPLLVQMFVGEAQKGTYYGTFRLWTLMVALLAQALMGMFSDRSTLPWGRRRPFIFIGTLGMLIFITAIGFSSWMTGMAGYWFLFAMGILLSVASNTAQGPQQALIPDIVPEDKRGRFSGVKAMLEAPLPFLLVAFTIARIIAAGHLWGGILLAMAVLVVVMAITMLVPEKRLTETPPPFDWTPIGRLAAMTAIFTAIILGLGEGIKLLGRLLAGVNTPALLITIVGVCGLIAMALAVGLGVWISVRISVGGQAARSNPSFTWWVVNRLAFLIGTTNLGTFAVYFLQGRLGLVREKAAGPAALLMSVIGICVLVSALPSGWLADRFGRRRLVGLAGLLAALGVLIALLSPSMTVIYVGGSLIGIAAGLFFTANWALGTELAPQAEAGRYLGIANLAGAGAGAVGAYIGGPLADYLTVRLPGLPGIGYILLFAVYGVMFLLSVVAVQRVHEPKSTRQSP
jgi:MFS family permease